MPRDPSPEREIFNIGNETDFDEDLDFEPEPYKKPGRIARLCTYISAKFKKTRYVRYDDDI